MSDLAASEYAVRREAFMRLWASGSAALPAVREATASSTAPTAAAARVLELLLKLDIQPQDNDELAELINLSRGAAPRAIMELASRGHWRLATELLKTNPTLLSAFRAQPRQDWLCVLVQYAFDQGDAAKSWPLVQQLLGPVQQQYLSVKTGLALETPASGWTTDQRALRLLFDGQPDEAWQLSPSLPVQQRIVLLSGKWDWLQQDSLRIAFLGNEPRSPRSLARQAAYRYLCGDRLGSDRLAAEALDLLQTAEATPPADNNPARNRRSVLDGFDSETEQLLVALLICGQGDAVHERVIKANSTDNLIYFADRLEYERVLSSFGLSENLNDFDPWLDDTLTKLRPLLRQPAPTRGLSEFQHLVELSTLLVSMGKSQQSIQLYQKLMDTIQDAPGVYRDQAWSFLASQGRNSQFRPHLIRLLDDRGGELSPEARERVLAALYPEWTAVASSLWRTAPPEFVQMPLATTTKAPAGEPGEKIRPKERRWALLERLWRFDRSLAQAERQTLLENWLRLAMREASRMDETLPQAASQMSAIALELGLRDLALNFAYAGSSRASADVAQVHMQTNRLSSAIEYWDQAIRSDPRQHRWLLEDIDACLTLGEDDKAQMLEASRWLRPLAADRMGVAYVQVASGLNEDGRHARAQEYGQAAFAMYDPDSSQFIQSAREYSESLRELEDFGTAAKVHRAANLMLLQERNLGYPLVALQHFVADELLTQAIAEVEAGHIEIALDCIARFEKLRPAGIEICELTYPRLVRQGRQSEADQLLQRCSQRMLSHLQKWSDDAGSHNNYAWMLARCNQRLDEAREHAEIAVKLSDGAPTYIDTLAEILFRQGQTDQAIQRAEQCVRLDPRHYHYRKQLDLFRTARREQQNSASAPARP